MELAILVYLVNLLPEDYGAIWFLIVVGTAVLVMYSAASADYSATEDFEDILKRLFGWKVKLTIVMLVVASMVLPTRQTAIYMAGAYLVQEVVTSDVAAEVGNKTQKAVLAQLDKWAAEVPELREMVQDVVETKVNTEVANKVEEIVK